VSHVTETSFSALPFGFVFLKTRELSPMNMAKRSIRACPKWKRVTVEDGVQIWWLTAEGFLKGDTNW